VLGALALPVNAAIGFESKMADIRKVVDGLDDKKAFAQMSDDILTLSTQLPMAAEGIAEIVAAGGQAGIARGDLMQFANDAVKMGVAFDTTAEESGQMMAQWRTAFKLTQEDVVVLADKINYLGNTGPANAKKISDIVTRIGPLGGVAGVASGEIAAMGATIAGMGVESEIASTGIKNFMLSL
ncbi:phage tail tape measure protein, partial [Salmonella enterica]|nr:phage tail tape measure protein [Salmonella enterica]